MFENTIAHLMKKSYAPGEDRTHDLQISLWSFWIIPDSTAHVIPYGSQVGPTGLPHGPRMGCPCGPDLETARRPGRAPHGKPRYSLGRACNILFIDLI